MSSNSANQTQASSFEKPTPQSHKAIHLKQFISFFDRAQEMGWILKLIRQLIGKGFLNFEECPPQKEKFVYATGPFSFWKMPPWEEFHFNPIAWWGEPSFSGLFQSDESTSRFLAYFSFTFALGVSICRRQTKSNLAWPLFRTHEVPTFPRRWEPSHRQ